LAGAAVAVPWLVMARALGKGGSRPASERVTVGVIGTGVRGMANMQGTMRSRLSQVTAVCDCRTRRRKAAVAKVNQFYAEQTDRGTYRGCGEYHDFRELLGREEIDAVLVCPPDHWHGVIATRALRAGKDLYCEKPFGLTITECKAIRDAVRRYGRVFQTGTQQRSDARFRLACRLARGGYLGKIRTIEVAVPPGGSIPRQPPAPVPPGFDYDMWTGPAPLHPFDSRRCEWLAMYWIYDYCVGFIANWGVHHLDIAQWGCPEVGTEPFELEGTGVLPTEGMCDTIMTWRCQLRYAGDLRLSYTNSRGPFGWQKSQGVTEECARVLDAVTPELYHQQGCRFIGEEGWVHVSRRSIAAEPKSLLSVNIPPDRAPLEESRDHYENFLQSVLTRRDPVAPVEAGFRASVLGNVADIALRLGRKVRWDPTAEQFVGDAEANRMQSRAMRAPWTL
ncbi:MAG TPA: Gfo/Idh/MocA family oxidoreductase, partial [Planctomycetaceae bacterium]|nr:Gfo/Idh/MocA family oxidoreductase [Planctomycetaceae bacterium]